MDANVALVICTVIAPLLTVVGWWIIDRWPDPTVIHEKPKARGFDVILTQRTAFSFTEALFAVMILGIGFILIAAIFPVAIQQTKTTTDETNSASHARGVVAYLDSLDPDLLAPTVFVPPPALNRGEHQKMIGELGFIADWRFPLATQTSQTRGISPQMFSMDRSRGAVVFYQRDGTYYRTAPPLIDEVGITPASTMKIIVVTTQSPGGTTYTNADPVFTQPQPVNVILQDGVPDTATISDLTSGPLALSGASDAAVEGATIITSDGYVYRLGNPSTGGAWELMPGSDMKDATENFNGTAFLIGRRCVDPADLSKGFSGPTQAVSTFTTFMTGF